jgi:NADH-quinone oxidoreductase subunit G
MAQRRSVTILVDDAPYVVDPTRNLLDVCLGHGLDVPYFCWHPALGSVGACRQCAVKQYQDESDAHGRVVMACLTEPREGGRFAIEDPDARAFRKAVIEGLMLNHPHDCPICDEGGECHLQDMTVMTGHAYRRTRFAKRTYRNQYLGPLLNHEMNRCIQCYRCVRFYRDHAGGHDLEAFGAHDGVYFGRAEDGVLESEFAGNLVEVCPTGVFTDKSLKQHYARKWDMRSAPSVCHHCSLGCNLFPGERYGALRRVWARYHGAVNGYFLCDRGRYGYEHANHERRLRSCLFPSGAERPAEAATKEQALARLGPSLARAGKVVGIGSPRASLEANFALRTLVGERRFYQGVIAREAQLVAKVAAIVRDGPAPSASLREVERADAALVLGEDVTNTAPMLALALRQAAREQTIPPAMAQGIPRWHDAALREMAQGDTGPLYLACATPTKLDDAARQVFHAVPDEVARLGFAVAHALDPAAPEVPELRPEVADLAAAIAADLTSAERPVVVSGTSLGSEAILDAASAVARALEHARPEKGNTRVFLCVGEANSLGLALLGGDPLEAALLEIDEATTVIVLENDLERRLRDDRRERSLARAAELVVVDHLAHDTAERATAVLPAAAFGEADGTFVNNEGRAQRFYQVFVPEPPIQESWRWLRDLEAAAGGRTMAGWHGLDDVLRAIGAALPELAGVTDAAPDADFRIAGARLPRAPHRYSGRTAMHAHLSVHEPRPPDDPDTPFSFTMEGAAAPPPPALLARLWAPGWNSVQALTRFQEEIAGQLRGGDPGVRLLEPRSMDGAYPATVPAAWSARADVLRVVALHHAFGSEELSALAPALAELAPAPYLALAPDDAHARGVADGDTLTAVVGAARLSFPLRVLHGLPTGSLGVPVGLGGIPAGPLAEWARVEAA